MLRYIGICVLFLSGTVSMIFPQQITGEELLQKTLRYHDPEGNWGQSAFSLELRSELPDGKFYQIQVDIDLPGERFTYRSERNGHKIEKGLVRGACFAKIDDRENPSEEEVKEYRLDCPSIERTRNYYLYLYGLPMKLQDPGTLATPEVKMVEFQGKKYLELRITYEPEVGDLIWLFYINPETYAMGGYQFFRDENTRKGEYILLEGEKQFNNMRIPADRSWYTETGEFLGKDILVSIMPAGE